MEKLPAAVAQLRAQINQARGTVGNIDTTPSSTMPVFTYRPERLAVMHYKERIHFDDNERKASPSWGSIGIDDRMPPQLRAGMGGQLDDTALQDLVGFRIDVFRRQGLTKAQQGSPEWRELAMALCAAEYEALSRFAERDEGDFEGHPTHPILNTLDEPEPPAPVDLMALWKDYVASRQIIGSMRDGGRRQVLAVKSLLEHTKNADANLISKQDIAGWRDAMLEELSATTLSKVYLPTINSLFRWAVENGRMTANPAKGIRQPAPKTMKLREPGYTDAEALLQIQTSRLYDPKLGPNGKVLENPKVTLAKRWMPLLCAFSGARITELLQLRREDVWNDNGQWVFRITPEAGAVKTNQYRDVPLHPQIVELGFSDEIETLNPGPMFHMAPSSDLNNLHAKKMGNRLRKWLHEENLVPKDLQPWHAWRHRFKTVGLELGINSRVLDAIQGHAGRTAGEMYGNVTLKTKIAAISQFPAFKLDP